MLDISFHNNTVAATQFDRLAVADELDAPTHDIDKIQSLLLCYFQGPRLPTQSRLAR